MPSLDGYDANDHEPTGDFEPMPRGEYPGMAIDSEWKETKKGDGRYMQFAFEIVDGDFRGRKLWDRLNLDNPNATAVKIANGTLSAICRAVGVMRPKKSEELHGKKMILKVDVEERNDKPGVFRNVIKGYAPMKAPSTATTATETGPAKPSSDKPPWLK